MNKLAKNYDKLSPAERFSLIIAAQGRGDEVERLALVDSAPKVSYRVADVYGRALAFERLNMANLLERLSFGCLLLWSSYLSDDREGRAWPLVEELAGNYLSHAEAWRLFCGENQINPDDLISDYPGAEVLAMVDKLASAIAPDDLDPGEYLAALRSRLAELAENWG